MSEKFKRSGYTSNARRIALKYPFFSMVSIHMNFWTVAYLLMFSIIYLGSLGVMRNLSIDYDIHFAPPLLTALFIGLSYGFIIGSINYHLEKRLFRNLSFWRLILYQTLLSTAVLLILVFISRTLLFENLLRYFSVEYIVQNTQRGWSYLVIILIVYTFMMSILLSFINQMNKKFGPGILIPMLLGRFRNPREEERVFMFLDLKRSTTYAEKLGHLKYSAFIRDCFLDVNKIIRKYFGEIYQYVGDEIVITWDLHSGFDQNRVLDFYFSCRDYFESRRKYYEDKFGIFPEFKAGVHMGLVTVVEVGDIKRDIAYHGDTLNVASRIENLCKQENEEILISDTVYQHIQRKEYYDFQSLGDQMLKGRKEKLQIFKVLKAAA